MLQFIIVISFILHFLAFFIIILQSMRINQLKSSQNLEQTKQEIEEILAAYMLEMKEENDKFMNILTNISQTNTVITAKQQVAHTEESEQQNRKEESETKIETPAQQEDEIEFIPPLEQDQQDKVEQSLDAKVLHLHQKGHSIEEIARQLNIGKTEIELILKFRR